ncbi:HAD family hydrolase [Rhizobium sp.]
MKISGILFDKDGTLLDFAKSWEPVNRRCAHYAADGDAELAGRLMRACGMDPETGVTVGDSLFAAASTGEIAAGMIAAGSPHGLEDLSHHFDLFFLEGAANAVPLTDLQKFFLALKARGLKVGIASSDNEASIRKMAEGQHILPLLDYVSGYDSGHGVKPNPGMIDGFARDCGLAHSEIAMVGDNAHDMHMARNAKAGLAVGVLTGTGTEMTLSAIADHVLGSIEDLEGLLDRVSK